MVSAASKTAAPEGTNMTKDFEVLHLREEAGKFCKCGFESTAPNDAARAAAAAL